MKKFVTTRGPILASKSSQWNQSPISSDVNIEDEKSFASSETKEEISENDSGIEVCDPNEESSKLKLSLNSTCLCPADVPKCSESNLRDFNNNFEVLEQNIKKINGNVKLMQANDVTCNSREYIFPSSSGLSMNSNMESPEHFGRIISESCISNFRLSHDFPFIDLKNRMYVKKHEAALYKIQKNLSCLQNDITNSSPSLTCNPTFKKEVMTESAPLLHESSNSSCKTSLYSIPDLNADIVSDENNCQRISNIYQKSKRHKKCSSHLTLPKKCLNNPSLIRKWCSNESLSKQVRSKLPDIVEEHAKCTLTSAVISMIQNKYLGAESLAETLQDIFILTNLLKRFADCEPPDKILNLEEFKAKRFICKRAIRNFMINVKNAILNYESLSFVDSCRLSCCLSYADVVACSSLLIDYLSISSCRNVLAAKVSSVGSTFCRVAILANSSFGKHSSEKSSKVFFQSTDRLIQNLNDLTVHVKNLKQHSVSRKF